jgi:two-component system, LytTR family, response regulator
MSAPLRSTPWTIVAIDDEPPALKAIARLIDRTTDFQLLASTSDPMLAEGLIREREPDIVFLDVRMPGRSGFDIARALGPDAPLIVFITAHDQFAVDAFEAQALDYLLKPVDPMRFERTLERLRRALSTRESGNIVPRIEAVLEQLAARERTVVGPRTGLPARIGIKHGGRTSMIDPRTIDRLDADDNDVAISIAHETIRVRETLTSLLSRLPDDVFLRISRSCAVNRNQVRQLEPYFHGDVVLHLANGTKAISGRTFRKQVRAAFGLTDETS